ncbi:serine/threonine-protein kinase [Gephyromycinifex aptenodytis]|uniref:serine/threonine-protein kinase n=1 Tax=Gephyromycinifex aptenodytis TaxID=2716227 RepID=UPI001446D891|nr:serine/threonine-protein kinase [Gephyromycinifex aptenodytis]
MSVHGQIGSRYVVEAVLGRGSFGQVWAGRDRDGAEWAIKVLREDLATDHAVVERFVKERAVLASVRHPNVVGVHDLVVEGDTLAIVMDLIEGSQLRAVLRSRGTLAPAEVAAWGSQLAAALGAAHAIGVVHRDVKPENVIIDAYTGQAMLMDFGIARLLDGAARCTMMVGTPQYVAPEVALGGSGDASCDLYALGVMMYEMCCGITPFAGRSTMAALQAHAYELPARPPGIPEPLWDIIVSLLAKSPQRRPSSAAALSKRLAHIAEQVQDEPAAVQLLTPFPVARQVGPPTQPTSPGVCSGQDAPAAGVAAPGAPTPGTAGFVAAGLAASHTDYPHTRRPHPGQAHVWVGDSAASVPEDPWGEVSSARLSKGVLAAVGGLVVCTGLALTYILGGGGDSATAEEPAPAPASSQARVPAGGAQPSGAAAQPGPQPGAGPAQPPGGAALPSPDSRPTVIVGPDGRVRPPSGLIPPAPGSATPGQRMGR